MPERTVFESISHRQIVSVPPHASVLEAVWAMTGANCNCLLIIDKAGAMVGILTEHDLLTRVLAKTMDPKATQVSTVMTRTPFSVEPEMKVAEAVLVMIEHGVRHLPVVTSKSKILGVFSVRDALPLELFDATSLAEFNDQVSEVLA